MRFLLDANLPRMSASAIRNLGFECQDVRDANMRSASDSQIAAYAKAQGFTLVSRDVDFADVRNYPPQEYNGIIVLRLPDATTGGTVTQILTQFLQLPQLIQALPGRLAIVEPGHVRMRPG